MLRELLKRCYSTLSLFAIFYLLASPCALAQGTAFSYQSKLTDSGNPANGSYDMQFKLFDSTDFVTGNQVGMTITSLAVQVTDGAFTVQLDFGAGVYNGSPRFLEIGIRPAGSPGPFTVLAPRQPLTSTPYAIRSATAGVADTAANATNATTATNATQLGGVAANQYVVTTDARLSDARPPTAGSTNYVQNRTSQQAATNFNISGNGTIGGNLTVGGSLSLSVVNAQTHFSIANSRVLAAPGMGNLFGGVGAGASHTTGQNNTLFGSGAGAAISTSNGNSFFGRDAGNLNTGGQNNSFFGDRAGAANMTGNFNSFFGEQAGANNTGSDNSFFGRAAGGANTIGSRNAFFGKDAGASNTTGSLNVFFGWMAGNANTNGGGNAFIGWRAGVGNTTGCCNTFVGESAGTGNTTGSDNVFIGISTGAKNTTGNGNTFIGSRADYGPTTGFGNDNTLLGARAVISGQTLSHSTAIGAGATVTASNTIVLGTASDVVVIPGLGTAGGSALCRNASNQISNCSSSLRYKTDVLPFAGGLEIVGRMQPISFTWKEDGTRDIGLGAEDVERVEPLLAFRNQNGEIEGVKYDQLAAVFINAFKDQQAQITRQQAVIDSLKKIVCNDHPNAELCK